jgi:hypothetical protein
MMPPICSSTGCFPAKEKSRPEADWQWWKEPLPDGMVSGRKVRCCVTGWISALQKNPVRQVSNTFFPDVKISAAQLGRVSKAMDAIEEFRKLKQAKAEYAKLQ